MYDQVHMYICGCSDVISLSLSSISLPPPHLCVWGGLGWWWLEINLGRHSSGAVYLVY